LAEVKTFGTQAQRLVSDDEFHQIAAGHLSGQG
jgi:hypothetical protein